MKRLPMAAGSILVTGLDEQTVRAGQVDPREILRFVRRGVAVHKAGNLHAKVYVFGRRAFVGSANASTSSAALDEACIEVTDPNAVRDARAFVERMLSVPVGPAEVQRLIPLFPESARRGAARGAQSAVFPKVFIVPVHQENWGDNLVQADKRGMPKAAAKLKDRSRFRLDKVPLTTREAARLAPDGIVVFRWDDGRGYQFEPAGNFIHAEPYSDGAIAYVEVRKHLRWRKSAQVRKVLGAAADAVLYKGGRVRVIRHAAVARKFLALWPAVIDAVGQDA
ncbi:MAG: hypothetical protein U1F56_01880 [Rubrivivax sp.]